jgi:hypothetical protein
VVGYWVTEELTVGGRAILRYRKDKRYAEELTTTDYGAAAFARYFLIRNVFVQGEYEYLEYEYPTFGGASEREGFGSLLGGVGFRQPLGRNASFFLLGMYNFTWDEDERSPYAEPWILRTGVGFRF